MSSTIKKVSLGASLACVLSSMLLWSTSYPVAAIYVAIWSILIPGLVTFYYLIYENKDHGSPHLDDDDVA